MYTDPLDGQRHAQALLYFSSSWASKIEDHDCYSQVELWCWNNMDVINPTQSTLTLPVPDLNIQIVTQCMSFFFFIWENLRHLKLVTMNGRGTLILITHRYFNSPFHLASGVNSKWLRIMSFFCQTLKVRTMLICIATVLTHNWLAFTSMLFTEL